MSHPIGEPPPVTSFVPACSGSAPQREAPRDSRRMTAGFMLAGHPVGGEEARAAACRVAPCRSRSRPGEAPRRGPAGVARREQLIEARPRVQRVVLEPGRVVPGQVRRGIGGGRSPAVGQEARPQPPPRVHARRAWVPMSVGTRSETPPSTVGRSREEPTPSTTATPSAAASTLAAPSTVAARPPRRIRHCRAGGTDPHSPAARGAPMLAA